MDDELFDRGEFEFGKWITPFENAGIELLEVNYSSVNSKLVIQLHVKDDGAVFLIEFENVDAFRVIDEGGLLNVWETTKTRGGRPAQTTFKVRNSLWTQESPVSFLTSDGWSFIVATDWDCAEIVTNSEPKITQQS